MRKSKIIAVLMLCVFLLGGCAHSDVNTTDAKKTSTMNNSETASSEAEFTIYKIGRDEFDGLLENNSFADMAKVSSKAFNYPQDGNRYVTYSTLAVEMTDKYISLFKGETLQDYLAENGLNESVRQFVAFEAPYVPLSIWIKTDNGTCFLTVEDEANCTLYSQAKYAEKYKTLQYVMNELNEKTEITYDTENQIVDIVTK